MKKNTPIIKKEFKIISPSSRECESIVDNSIAYECITCDYYGEDINRDIDEKYTMHEIIYNGIGFRDRYNEGIQIVWEKDPFDLYKGNVPFRKAK